MTYSINNININGDITTTNVTITYDDSTQENINVAHYLLSGENEMNQNIMNRIQYQILIKQPIDDTNMDSDLIDSENQ